MKRKCFDVFSDYHLPFETYFSDCIRYDDVFNDELEIIWLIRGSAKVVCDHKELVMSSQTVLLAYMNKVHSFQSEPGSIVISYRLKKEHLMRNHLFFERIHYDERVFSFDELAKKYRQVPLLIVQIIKLLLTEEEKELVRYKIIGYYNMFIFELYSMVLKEKYLDVKTLDYDDYLNRIHMIVEYTYAHHSENIALEDLAKMTHISTFRLSHFITGALGVSYRTFLQNTRFEHAIKLLKESQLSVLEISKACGFSDHKYLSEMMKKRYHVTPLKYRRQMQEQIHHSNLPSEVYDFIQELKICIKKIEMDHDFHNLFGIVSV